MGCDRPGVGVGMDWTGVSSPGLPRCAKNFGWVSSRGLRGAELLIFRTLLLSRWIIRDAEYLLPSDRVIGIEIDGEYLAFPHNILWYHEIVNMDELGLAVTYCPFTGSSMVFHRATVGGDEFGVSGLLFKNNLVMYNRVGGRRFVAGDEETLWPQMLAGGRCGPSEGDPLKMYPSLEIEWADWKALHPDARVVSGDTSFGRPYTRYPYGDYRSGGQHIHLRPPR